MSVPASAVKTAPAVWSIRNAPLIDPIRPFRAVRLRSPVSNTIWVPPVRIDPVVDVTVLVPDKLVSASPKMTVPTDATLNDPLSEPPKVTAIG